MVRILYFVHVFSNDINFQPCKHRPGMVSIHHSALQPQMYRLLNYLDTQLGLFRDKDLLPHHILGILAKYSMSQITCTRGFQLARTVDKKSYCCNNSSDVIRERFCVEPRISDLATFHLMAVITVFIIEV